MKRKTIKRKFYKRRNRTNSRKKNNKSLKIKNRKTRNNRRRKVTKKSKVRGGAGIMDLFRRRRSPAPTTVTPAMSPRSQETIQMGDKKIDWDKLETLFGDGDKYNIVLPGQYRDKIGEGRCSRSVPATSRIRSCVERQEKYPENLTRPCNVIEKLCEEGGPYEKSSPSPLVSIKGDPWVAAKDPNKNNKIVRTAKGEAILFPSKHPFITPPSERYIPVTNAENEPGGPGFSNLKNEIDSGHIQKVY